MTRIYLIEIVVLVNKKEHRLSVPVSGMSESDAVDTFQNALEHLVDTYTAPPDSQK